MRVGMLLAVATALWIQPASAAVTKVSLTGTVTAETAPGGAAPIGVGNTLVLTAQFDPSLAVDWGNSGYQVVGFQRFGGNFNLQLGGYSWQAEDEYLDGLPFFTFSTTNPAPGTLAKFNIAAPALALKDGKVAGVFGILIPEGEATPRLDLGSSTTNSYIDCFQGQCSQNFGALNLGSTFQLKPGGGLYANFYSGPSFNGVWNFAQSSVTTVPEPATWAMLILGFGVIGAGLRRRGGAAARFSRVGGTQGSARSSRLLPSPAA